jgi:predicted Zn finger-like uncharacterized protein
LKIYCPKCRASSVVPDDKVPDEGIYARCPKCNVRLFIQKKNAGNRPPRPEPTAKTTVSALGISLDDQAFAPPSRESDHASGELPSQSSALPSDMNTGTRQRITDNRSSFVPPPPIKPTGRKPLSSQGLPLEKKEKDHEASWDPDWEVPISLGVERIYSGTEKALSVILGFVFLAVSIFIFVSVRNAFVAENITPFKRQPVTEAVVTEAYPDWAFEQDVRTIRRRLIRNNHSAYQVRLPGPEFRVLEEIMDRCGIECKYILDVKIDPRETRDGFRASVSCGSMTNQVEYLWTLNGAFSQERRCY